MSNIKSYKWGDSVQLTKNINVRELRCKDGSTTKIDLDHIQKVQNFMEKNGLNKVIFSSGYRSKTYNKKISGSTSSRHCVSDATDQCFYRNNKIVPSSEICCLAQDYGFKGIAYIDKNYVHLDSRPTGTYRGDERKGYSNNVPNGDFYKYFGISKNNYYLGTLPKLPKRGYFKKGDKGQDVKYLQELLNWLTDSKLVVDGIIGDKTISKVKTFQKLVKLTQDGLFGKETLQEARQYNK